MQYDLIYPSDIDQIRSVPCVVAASYFEAKELIAFGVSHSAFDVQNPFVEDNEFEKAFKLWDSPFYLRKFFNDNIEYFKFKTTTKNIPPNNPYIIDGIPAKLSVANLIAFTTFPFLAYSCKYIADKIPIGVAIAIESITVYTVVTIIGSIPPLPSAE